MKIYILIYTHIYNRITLLYSRNEHFVNQLYFYKINFKIGCEEIFKILLENMGKSDFIKFIGFLLYIILRTVLSASHELLNLIHEVYCLLNIYIRHFFFGLFTYLLSISFTYRTARSISIVLTNRVPGLHITVNVC